MSGTHIRPARLAASPEGYAPFGLEKAEDGEVVERHEELGSFDECYWQRAIHGDG